MSVAPRVIGNKAMSAFRVVAAGHEVADFSSEYPAVVTPVVTQHYTMLQRDLLYTRLTRSK